VQAGSLRRIGNPPGRVAAYDAAGNQTALSGASNPYLNLDGTFSYDGENRLLTATLATPVSYTYDGEGRRVQKTVGTGSSAVTTTFVHDAMGNLAAEYGGPPPPTAGTEHLSVDHLGSTRLVTDGSGNPLWCADYMPFGEEIPPGTSGRTGCYASGQYPEAAPDPIDVKFTGKERDAETGLDFFGARYFSGSMGRFTSPDPGNVGADIRNPQSWNAYAYTGNNPLRDAATITAQMQPWRTHSCVPRRDSSRRFWPRADPSTSARVARECPRHVTYRTMLSYS